MVRTRRESPLCDIDPRTCITSLTRFVWAGDQLLWEIKDAQGSHGGEAGGRVSYTHAGGIDRPLAIWKEGVGSIITHQNWRGQFARGTFTNGQLSDCTEYPPQGCVPVQWPGYATTAWHEGVATAPTTGYEHYWFGSLAVDMRDATGQLYRRNRYYDPQTGQFTQPDPIGLAGGLNAYGFAAGDPVTYRDPYGLRADSVTYLDAEIEKYVNQLRAADAVFDKAMRVLENDQNFMYVFEKSGLEGTPGMLYDTPIYAMGRLNPGDVQTALPIVSVSFHWPNIGPLNEWLRSTGLSGGPVTRQMVVGHEVFVHALPFSLSGGMRNACTHTMGSSNECGTKRHNALGARLGWSTRKGW